jgi:hypothetical protein
MLLGGTGRRCSRSVFSSGLVPADGKIRPSAPQSSIAATKQNGVPLFLYMNDFITKYQNELTGTLSGFDRLVFRGTLWRNRVSAMKGYLWAHHLARIFHSPLTKGRSAAPKHMYEDMFW